VSVPNAAELPADIFLEMTEELVTNAMRAPVPGRREHSGEGVTWAERGWNTKADFLAEFRAGIHASGVGVVARGLSRVRMSYAKFQKCFQFIIIIIFK
jgi:hypothetical protein